MLGLTDTAQYVGQTSGSKARWPRAAGAAGARPGGTGPACATGLMFGGLMRVDDLVLLVVNGVIFSFFWSTDEPLAEKANHNYYGLLINY